ncbi:MAG: hypothetical protein KGY56_13385 [Desulfobacterales bacterium]|nr:hypothetical protein [Desulfobacterales bacterium]
MRRIGKKGSRKWFWLGGILVLAAAFFGLRTYLTIKPADYPVNYDKTWNEGELKHILPTANHERFLIKTSFKAPLQTAPRLEVNGQKTVEGVMTDTEGRFWMFDVPGLSPDTDYELRIKSQDGKPLCESWPLKTFPDPDAKPEHVRLLIYTCLGGHDVHREWFKTGPQPLSIRHRLLNKALSFDPDAVISTGDQIYYDLTYDKAAKVMGDSPRSRYHVGEFDQDKPVLGTRNEPVLKRAADPQIACLYGTACRSSPTFFLLDDHDYFENDTAMKSDGFDIRLLLLAWRSPFTKGGISFPPNDFMLDAGRSVQKLYLPEFLPAPGQPRNLPGTHGADAGTDIGLKDQYRPSVAYDKARAPGVSECYGTLRYGKLLEALLYENRRYTTLTGPDAVMIHPEAEKWLIDRMKTEETRHVLNLPATVFGWSAGKWMEWYPDISGADGNLTTDIEKFKWQSGWFAQHNRLLAAASAMEHSPPLFICGDLHNQSEGGIKQSADLDLSENPVVSICSGSLGTGPRMWPSAFRGMKAEPPNAVEMNEKLSPLEKNGFVIVDVYPEKITVKFYAWRQPEPVTAIDDLKPHHKVAIKRR